MSPSRSAAPRTWCPPILGAACCAVLACATAPSETGTSSAAAPAAAATDAASSTPAATSTGSTSGAAAAAAPSCLPTANEVSVGMPCTRGGGQCSVERAGICTADLPRSTTQFCTRICVAQDCGSQAACVNVASAGAAALYLCVPDACVPAGVSTTATVPANPCMTAAGNNDLVGKLCTYGGHECDSPDPNAATTCLGDLAMGSPVSFCTKIPCSADADCGVGGTCEKQLADLPQGICMLTSCVAAGSALAGP